MFSGSTAGWVEIGTLDDSKSAEGKSGLTPVSPVGRLKTGAFATFRDADSRGQTGISSSSPSADTKMLTVHQNTITSVRPYEYSANNVTKVSTSGVDGTLVVWDANAVSPLISRVGGLQLR